MFTSQPSIGRYDPCPCRSGKKYKFCCETEDRKRKAPEPEFHPEKQTASAIEWDDIEPQLDEEALPPDAYYITSEPLPGLDDRMAANEPDRYAELHCLTMERPASAIEQLNAAVAEYPENRTLKNWLTVAYNASGRDADAIALTERLYRDEPDYLFARTAMAEFHLSRGELEKVPLILGGATLKQIYPRRTLFHATEALSLWSVLARWHLLRGEEDKAHDFLDLMMEMAPDHNITQQTRLIMLPLGLKSLLNGLRFRKRGNPSHRRPKPPGSQYRFVQEAADPQDRPARNRRPRNSR